MTGHNSLRGRELVLDTLDSLQAELVTDPGWENQSLDRFLEAFNALLGSIENAYNNSGRPMPSSPWELVAEALRGARFYE